MSVRGLLIWILCLSMACRFTNGRPGNVLEPNKMAAVMWDLVRVDEYAATRTAIDSVSKVEANRQQLYQQVFQLHKMDAATFRTSYQYYEAHPAVMRTILDTIAVRYARKQNQHSNQQPKPTIQAY